MDSGENLERRVAAVESEVAVARREAAAARALAAGADRDVADYRAEMRAHTRGLNALRQTQLEHYAEHKADMTEFRAEVKAEMTEFRAEVKAEMTELRTGVEAGMARFEAEVKDLVTATAKLTAGMTHIQRLLESPEGRSGSRDG